MLPSNSPKLNFRLALGTANFYKTYGFVKPQQLHQFEISKISDLMHKFDLNSIDTALSYSRGDLGDCSSVNNFFNHRKVTTEVALRDLINIQSTGGLTKVFLKIWIEKVCFRMKLNLIAIARHDY